MPVKGKEVIIQYTTWDTVLNEGKLEDTSNHTLRLVRDGVAIIPENSPFEIDSVLLPGLCGLQVSEEENSGNMMSLHGISSTEDVIIVMVQWSNESNMATIDEQALTTKAISNFNTFFNNEDLDTLMRVEYIGSEGANFIGRFSVDVGDLPKTVTFEAKGQTCVVTVPIGGVTGDSFDIIIQQFPKIDVHNIYTEVSPENVYLIQAVESGTFTPYDNADISEIQIQVPIDLTDPEVIASVFETGDKILYYASSLQGVESGIIDTVPTTDILSSDYDGDGNVGSITFKINHLSIFAAGDKLPLADSPDVLPSAGAYPLGQTISMSSTVPGAIIHYTETGVTPTLSDPKYTGPFVITESPLTIKARVFAFGYLPSDVTQREYTVPVVETPIIDPISGAYPLTEPISITCGTPTSVIYYTTDGSDPTEGDTLYTAPFVLGLVCTVKARAFHTEYLDSAIATEVFTQAQIVTPNIEPDGGEFLENQSISITCATPEVVIYYTTDGTEPNQGDYIYSSPFNLSIERTIKSKAFDAAYIPSEVDTQIYSITRVDTPSIEPVAGEYLKNQVITIGITPPGTIYYTLDGGDPTESSIEYTAPFVLGDGCTIKARGFEDFYLDSIIDSNLYTITQTATPDIEPDGNEFIEGVSVSITCSTPASVIYFTKNGLDPLTVQSLTLKKSLMESPNFQDFVSALTYDSGNDILIAGTTPRAQIWKSTDQGETWNLKKDLYNETLPQLQIESLTYDSTNNVLLAGTYPNAQIWKSINGGESWTLKKDLSNETLSQTHIESLVQDSTNNVLIAGTYPNAQIWKSTDQGETWNLKKDLSNETPSQDSTESLTHDPTNNVLLAGTNPDAQIWKSTNGGESWTLKKDLASETPSQFRVRSLIHDHVNNVSVAGTGPDAQLWKSTDAGENWTLKKDLSNEATPQVNVESLTYDSINDVLLAGTNPNAQVWKSVDEGENWTLKKDLSNEDPLQTRVESLIYDYTNNIYITGTGPHGQLWKGTNHSRIYTSPFILDESKTVKAIAITQYYLDSEIDLEVYTLVDPSEFIRASIPLVDADDGSWKTSSFTATANALILGNETDPWKSFIRFPNIKIPSTATITNAFIRVTSQSAQSDTTVNLRVHLNDSDNAVAPTTEGEANSLGLTSASIDWSGVSAWADGSFYSSPDIKAAVQEVINRAGWSKNNALMVVVLDDSSTTDAYREASALPWVSGEEVVELHITYTDTYSSFTPISSNDDGSWYSTTWGNGSNTLGMGFIGSERWNSHIRFPNVTIPKGVTITEAFIEFYVHTATIEDSANLTVELENIDDSDPITSFADIGSRSLTSATAWDSVEPWKALEARYESVDITSLVQTVINHSGWVSGNAMQAYIKDAGSSTSGRLASSFDHSSQSRKAILRVNWEF